MRYLALQGQLQIPDHSAFKLLAGREWRIDPWRIPISGCRLTRYPTDAPTSENTLPNHPFSIGAITGDALGSLAGIIMIFVVVVYY